MKRLTSSVSRLTPPASRLPSIAILFVLTAVGAAPAAPILSGAGDRDALALTVYNADFGFVTDARRIELGKGINEVRFEDVASEVVPASVRIRSQDRDLSVLEQRYEYDLQTADRLMQRYIGKKVKVLDRNPATGEDREIEAVLIGAHGQPVFRVGDEIHIGLPGRIVFPELPSGLVTAPTLVWRLESSSGGTAGVRVSYLTNQIRWQADYTLVLEGEEGRAALSSWATIDNRSGVPYPKAELKLVAGTVRRVDGGVVPQPRALQFERLGMAAMAADMAEESFSDLHLYTIERPVDIGEHETTQIQLFAPRRIETTRKYTVRAMSHFFRQPVSYAIAPQPADVSVEFENEESNQLGIPLPEGVVRIYAGDAAGALQFSGEDRVQHTPKDETVRLQAGKAFDVVGERKQTDYKIVAKNVWETAWEVAVRNRKKSAVSVDVIEPIANDWEIVSSSHDPVKEDAQTLRFELQVPAGKEVVLKYRVRVRVPGN